MTDSQNPLIHIIPDLKELSTTATGVLFKTATGVSKHCGAFGFTDENCIGDFNGHVLTKRNNYHTGNNKFPNNFLVNKEIPNFKVVNAGLVIAKTNLQYLQNWNTLFQTINGIITQPQSGGVWPLSNPQQSQQPQGQQPRQPQQPQQPRSGVFDSLSQNVSNVVEKASATFANNDAQFVQSDKKKNVFISCHQHVLQNMFFKFKKLNAEDLSKKDSCGKSMKQYGFRNCTCIKISNEGNEWNKGITITVIHSENTGRDKFKYKYIDENINLIEQNSSILDEGTYPLVNNLLEKCDIYMIRHGEAVHNLKDVHAVRQAKRTCNPTEAAQIDITDGNNEMLNNMNKGTKLNALLTTQGIEQSNNLYTTKLKDIMKGKQNIYISSPMDRTIETLIFATSPNGNDFLNLKAKFMEMYKVRFPITAAEIDGLDNDWRSVGSTDSTVNMTVPSAKSMGYGFRNPFRSNPTPQGGKRKSRRKVNKKSKKRKSVKARKTKKRSRNTKKRYQKGCSRK